MEPIGISLIIVYIAAIIAAFFLVGKIIRALFVISLVTILLLLGVGFFVYKDIVDIKTNVKEGIMVVLVDDGTVLSGFAVEDEPVFFDDAQLSQLSAQYGSKDYSSMLGSKNRLFIVDAKMIEELKDEPIGSPEGSEGKAIPASLALTALRSNEPSQVLASKDPSMELAGASSSQIKGDLLASIFTESVIQDPANAITQLKNDNLNVYPQTALFRVLQYIPVSMVKKLVSDAKEKGSEAKDAVMDKV